MINRKENMQFIVRFTIDILNVMLMVPPISFCRFLPRVSAVIQETGIIVISARTEFEDVFPGDYYKWKIEAFKNLKRNYDEDVMKVSF